MYILIGRTKNYAWSLTSAGHDVRDVFAEQLCNPNGSAPTRDLEPLPVQGQVPGAEGLRRRPAGGQAAALQDLGARPGDRHGHVGGKPYALSRKRSTFGRDGLNLAALKDMTEGKATTPKKFFRRGQPVRVHLQLGLRLPQGHRVLHLRPPARGARAGSTGVCRRSAPASTSGSGFLERARAPARRAAARAGCCSTGTTSSAPGFMHGDDEAFGSVQRVELFDKFPKRVAAPRRGERHEPRRDRGRALAGVAGGQPGAARRRRRRTRAPRRSWTCSTTGSRRDAPRLDADDNGFYDEPGPAIMDARLAPDRRGGACGRCSARSCSRRRTTSATSAADRRVLRRQGPAHAARPARGGQVQPPLLRRRLARRLPDVALDGDRPGGGRAWPRSSGPTRPSG